MGRELMQLRALVALALGTQAGSQPLSAAPLARNADPSSPNVVFAGPKEPEDARLACAGLRLPDKVWSSPQTTTGWAREGFWETTDGAALAAWSQTSYGQETGMLLTVDSRLLARVAASPLDPKGREWEEGMDTVLLADDCEGERLFELRELADAGAPLEVYDRDDKLLAKAKQGDLKPDELYWQGADGKLIATVTRTNVAGDVNIFGGVLHFSFAFTTGIAALENQTLYAPQNRWVLLAATQARALRNADRDEDGAVKPGPVSFLVTTWAVLKWVLLAVSTYAAMHLVYLWVYYPEDLAYFFGLDPATMTPVFAATGKKKSRRKAAADDNDDGGEDYGSVVAGGPRRFLDSGKHGGMYINLP